ncbi:antA/AntB antirepressor family protein [Bartonella schoenbuchensis]|uniref:antA/AntB antirepressor family protein n=1 Tax=Bartonella schoenbuchensis TaxID=165694 RepID=UPI0031452062
MEAPITHQNNTTDQEPVQKLNARELHELLNVETNFNDWITQRIKEHEFKEGDDFRIEYYITLDMAKKLAQAEKSDASRAFNLFVSLCTILSLLEK